MFIPGQVYIRRDLHAQFGGQAQGGISTPARHPLLLLFTGEQGEQYGYRDGWNADGIFLYTGEGQIGDMTFLRGNGAIRDHAQNGKDIHLFQYVERGRVRYIGQMVCTGYQLHQAPDLHQQLRNVIVFELTPEESFTAPSAEPQTENELWDQPLADLRQRALASARETTTAVERRQYVRYRSAAVRIYVLKRANGICEGCGNPAPFLTSQGRPYLEPHHIRRLSDGGPDDPRWVAALCPNCHRRAHYAADHSQFNHSLTQIVGRKENSLLN